MNYDAKTPGTIERVYYAVPTHYTIGEEFPGTHEGHVAAVAAAKSTIVRFFYQGQRLKSHQDTRGHREEGDGLASYSRAHVDRREVVKWADGSGEDRIVERVELFLTDPEKDALRAAQTQA